MRHLQESKMRADSGSPGENISSEQQHGNTGQQESWDLHSADHFHLRLPQKEKKFPATEIDDDDFNSP